MRRGAVYIVRGQKAVDDAVASARSLLSFVPDVAVLTYHLQPDDRVSTAEMTGSVIKQAAFDITSASDRKLREKLYGALDFDVCLRLDADTEVLQDPSMLFSTALAHGLAVCKDPYSQALYSPGVVAWRHDVGVKLSAAFRALIEAGKFSEVYRFDRYIFTAAVKSLGLEDIELPVKFNDPQKKADTVVFHPFGAAKYGIAPQPSYPKGPELKGCCGDVVDPWMQQ